MHDIDFLPAEYRKQSARRHVHARRGIAMAALVAVLAIAATVQRHAYRQAEQRHAVIAAEYEAVAAQKSELARLQSDWDAARNDAELFTYLRYPWPRTQILATLLNPLPESIALKRVEIRPDASRRPSVAARLSRAEQETAEAADAKLAPAVRDLRALREGVDSTRTTIIISGTTRRIDLLHEYLDTLGQSNLFTKVDLDSVESAKEDGGVPGKEDGVMRFAATVIVCPGHGQATGPTGHDQAETRK